MEDEKVYIGTKIIRAVPMDKYAFECEKDNVPPSPETRRIEEGYKVTYEDGYKSWSPKEVFERCYREITPMEILLTKF